MTERLRPLVERYLAALLASDRSAALRLMLDQGLGQGLAVPDLYHVVEAAQHRIGVLWQENRISVAQEHVATATSQLVLAHLYPALPRAWPNGKLVLVACVEGEQHDMGARVAAEFVEMAGFDVRVLGASVPRDTLVATVRQSPPDLLVLSATMTFHVPQLRDTVLQSREAGGDRVRLAIGGHALTWTPRLVEQLAIDVPHGSAPQMIQSACRVLGVEHAA
jgi:methanogenic corrinoid protein MtbC1